MRRRKPIKFSSLEKPLKLSLHSLVYPPSPTYLDLYRLFEDLREHQGWISFDDMLIIGWQILVQYPDLLSDLQQQFDCIIVDEFQDVNRAQFGILDLLARPHLNYMVIGDDDQTIYEWRGAEVRFILNAFDRYQPTDYQITDNFRCKAAQVTLANAVIRHNRNRYPKQLNLTQGFDGCTQIHQEATPEQLGQGVVNQVKTALATNIAPSDIAILIRMYAQTSYIEQCLIREGIPYWGADLVPFYRRPEILNFLAFAQLAELEAVVSTELVPQATWIQRWIEAWNRVKLTPPIRYLSKDLKEQIQDTVTASRTALSQVLSSIEPGIRQERTACAIRDLAKWLAIAPQTRSAQAALIQLDTAIRYRENLKHRSGFKETGQGKAAGVEAMINYASDKGTLFEFLNHLDQLQQQAEEHTQNPSQCVRLTTIHQAKGLEWSVVLIPHCNQGMIPFGEDLTPEELEEERRLLYVAITRAKKDLHLHLLQKQPVSQFLQEAQFTETLRRTQRLHQQMQSNPQTWQALDVASIVKAVDTLGLDRYFQQWWIEEPAKKVAIAETMQRCLAAARHHQVLSAMGIQEQQLQLWQAIAPSQALPSTSFPGLEFFIKPHSSKPDLTSNSDSTQSQQDLLGTLKPRDRVEHGKFGQGLVTAVKLQKANSEAVLTVDFQAHGVKNILITKQFCTLKLVRKA